MTIAYEKFHANDTVEPKFIAVSAGLLATTDADRDDFYDGAYEAAPLGDVLFALQRDPIASVLSNGVYRTSFPAIHDLFTQPGTFEFYLSVFRAIYGEDADVTFTVPGPGRLTINANSVDVINFDLLARRVVDDDYVYEQILTLPEMDNLAVRDTQGLKTEDEIRALIYELAPTGIFTTVNLT